MIFLCWRALLAESSPVDIIKNSNDERQVPDKLIFERDENYNYLQKRKELLKEIVGYHEALKRAENELTDLKKERDILLKKLEQLKSILEKKSKAKLK